MHYYQNFKTNLSVLFPKVLKVTANILLKSSSECYFYILTRIFAGHEAAFAAFLCCLCKIGVLGTEDQLAMVFKVFTRWAPVFQHCPDNISSATRQIFFSWGLYHKPYERHLRMFQYHLPLPINFTSYYSS